MVDDSLNLLCLLFLWPLFINNEYFLSFFPSTSRIWWTINQYSTKTHNEMFSLLTVFVRLSSATACKHVTACECLRCMNSEWRNKQLLFNLTCKVEFINNYHMNLRFNMYWYIRCVFTNDSFEIKVLGNRSRDSMTFYFLF